MVAFTSASMIWKSKTWNDPLCSLIFPSELNYPAQNMSTRSVTNNSAKLPVPGSTTLAANLLARAWNEAPSLKNATTLGAAKLASRKWARSLQFKI